MFIRADACVHHVRIEGPARSLSKGSADPPPVVFANSLGTDLRIWDDVVARLDPPLRTIRYDMRGHGLTEAPAPPYSIAGLARDLEQLLDALDVRSAVLCGISVGGMVALQIGATRPDRVAGLILCDTGDSIGTADFWNARIGAVMEGGTASIAEMVMTRWFSRQHRDERRDDVAGYRCLLERSSVAGYVGVAAAIRDADLEAAARAVRVPTLVLCGDQDEATPPDLNRSLAAAIPGARFELVPGAAHLPCIEQPALVAAHISSFVKAHAYA